MSIPKTVAKRRRRLAIEPLEPRRLLDVSGVWQELGFRSASGSGITYNSFFQDDYQPDMALNSQDRPWVANVQNGEIVATFYNGFTWVSAGLASDAKPYPWSDTDPDIEIALDDTVYIAWRHINGSAGTSNIYLKVFDGNSWQELGGSATDEGISVDGVNNYEPALAIGADGLPIVAYTAYDLSGNDMEIVVKKWDGNRWVELTNTSPFGATQGTLATTYGGGVSNDIFDSSNPDITVDNNGYPIVVWSSQSFANNAEIYIRRWNGSEWREIGLDSASGPPGKFGVPDTHPSYGISNRVDALGNKISDDTMSLFPVVGVTDENTIIVAWIDYQNYPLRTNAGIYVRKFEDSFDPDTDLWVDYSPGSAQGRGIVGRNSMTFVNLRMDIGPHLEEIEGGAPLEDTPALTWVSTGTGLEPFVARYNPVESQWYYLVGDGDDTLTTDAIDGPEPWSTFGALTSGPTPDATGYRNTLTANPTVGVSNSTGHEILAYSYNPGFPDSEIYAQQYRSTRDFYEIRDLDETQTIDITAAWVSPSSKTGDLLIEILDHNGQVVQTGVGTIGSVTPELYEDPDTGEDRGRVRVRLTAETWGEQAYTLTIDQGGATQTYNENEAVEPNDTFLKRNVITSASGNQEARTVVVNGSINNEWVEIGDGSFTPGGVDGSLTRSSSPVMATAFDGRPVMAWIDSNPRWADSPSADDSWLEVKIWDERFETWVDLAAGGPFGEPLQSDVISGALAKSPAILGTSLNDPIVKMLDISSDPYFIHDFDLSGNPIDDPKLFVAVTDGYQIEVYQTRYKRDYDPLVDPYAYEPWELVGGGPAYTAPGGNGLINWISVQSGPDGEAALAWEWLDPDGLPAREIPARREIEPPDLPETYDYYNFSGFQGGDTVTITMSWVDPGVTGPLNFEVWWKDDSEDGWDHEAYTGSISNVPVVDPDEGLIIGIPQHDSGGDYTLDVVMGGGVPSNFVDEVEVNNFIDNEQYGPQPVAWRIGGVRISGSFDYPRLGSTDIYLSLWDGTSWGDMESGSRTAPNVYGQGGWTDTGQARYPDLDFVPTPADPQDPSPTGENEKGQYVLVWSFGAWGDKAGEPGPTTPTKPEDRYDTGFQHFGVKLAWFDKNTDTWVNETIVTQNNGFWWPVEDWAGLAGAHLNYGHILGTTQEYPVQVLWPSVTVGDTGQPFISFTVEIYDPGVGVEPGSTYLYRGSWIGGYQYPGVYTSVSAAGDFVNRIGGNERVDDVLMSQALGNAGQLPVVVWQSVDVDVTDPPDGRTTLPHDRLSAPTRDDAEDTLYDLVRSVQHSGGPYIVHQEIHARRWNDDVNSWERVNNLPVGNIQTVYSTDEPPHSASNNGKDGVDQFWSSGMWPSVALATDPESGFSVNDPVVGWLNQSEQTVYVRRWNHESQIPIVAFLENSDVPNDDVISFGEVMVGEESQWLPVTLANNGPADLRITEFNINEPFEILLTPQHQLALQEGGIVLPRGSEMVFRVRFAPSLEDAANFQDVIQIVTTDPARPYYLVGLLGTGLTGARIVVSEEEGIENDMLLPFGYVEPGQEKSMTFTITNDGEGTLDVLGMFPGLPEVFELSAGELTLQPGQSADVIVTFRPQSDLPVFDSLTVYSNDVNNRQRFVRLVGNAPALFNVTRVTDTQSSEVSPAISGDYVAYVRTGAYSLTGEPVGDIFLYNRTTGEESESPIGAGRDPQIWDDWVIFTGGLYDIVNDALYPFQDMPGLGGSSVSHVSVAGNRFAVSTGSQISVFEIDRAKLRQDESWGDGIGPGMVVRQVWGFNVAAVQPGATADYPALWGDWIAFQVAASGDHSREATDKAVYLYEYAAAAPELPIQLTPVGGAPGHMIPEFDNHRVVWMDDRWGTNNTQIFMYDVDSQTGYQLTDSFSDKAAQFAFSGNLIVWSDFRNANWDLFAFDLAQWEQDPLLARESQLTFDDPDLVDDVGNPIRYNQMNPAVSGAWIAFRDDQPALDESGQRPNNQPNQWDIRYAQFPGPPNLGVHEISGQTDDDRLNFGAVNVGVTRGVGLELRNTGYDVLQIDNYQFNNATIGDFVVYTYDDVNSNLQWDAGETRTVITPADLPVSLDVGERLSIWLEWTPDAVGTLPANANVTVFSNAEDAPEYVITLAGQGVLTPDMVVTPGLLNFGNVPVGTAAYIDVTITNIGNEDLILGDILPPTGSDAFTIDPLSGDKTVNPGGVDSYSFRVTFDAALVGLYSGSIQVYNNDPEFAGFFALPVVANVIVAPDIAVVNSQGTPITELMVGPVEVGRHKDVVITIRNDGQAPLQLTGWASSDTDTIFVVGGLPTSPIPYNGAVQVLVRFEPDQAGSYASGWIEFASNDPDVAGNAWGAPTENPYRLGLDDDAEGVVVPHIAVEETVGIVNDDTINFGTVVITQSVLSETFVVRNTGSAALHITGWTMTGDDSVFTVIGLPGPGAPIAPGGSVQVTVRLDASAPGDFTALLSIINDDPDPGASPYEVELRANVSAGQVAVTDSEIDFGQVEITQSDTRQFNIINSGEAPLHVTGVTITGDGFTLTAPTGYEGSFTLSPGETSPAFTITFEPDALAGYAGTVHITSDDPVTPVLDEPVVVGQGIGIPDLTVVGATGGALQFGGVSVGESKELTLTLRNDGTGTLLLTRWTTDNTVYVISPSNPQGSAGDISLAPGESVDVTVIFTPLTDIAYPGVLTIYSNDPDESQFPIQVNGTGTPPEVVGDFNGDGRIDMNDYELFSDAFGSSEGDGNYNPAMDLDGDGDVDYADLGIFLGYYDDQMKGASSKAKTRVANGSQPTVDGVDVQVQTAAASGRPAADADGGGGLAKSGGVTTTGEDRVTLVENLAAAFDNGALAEALRVQLPAAFEAAATDRGASASQVVGVAELAPAEVAAASSDTTGTTELGELGGLAQPTMDESVASPTAATGLSELAVVDVGFDDLGDVDPLVAPYAGALLPPAEEG